MGYIRSDTQRHVSVVCTGRTNAPLPSIARTHRLHTLLAPSTYVSSSLSPRLRLEAFFCPRSNRHLPHYLHVCIQVDATPIVVACRYTPEVVFGAVLCHVYTHLTHSLTHLTHAHHPHSTWHAGVTGIGAEPGARSVTNQIEGRWCGKPEFYFHNEPATRAPATHPAFCRGG